MATKRKNPKRVAAGKKAALTRRRNKTSPTKRRRTRTRTTVSKTFMGEITSKANLRSGGQMILEAAAGAGIAMEVNKAMTNQTKLQKVGLLAGLGYLAAVGLKMPAIGAGFAAVAGIEFLKKEDDVSMQENVNYLNEDSLNQLPDVVTLDENKYAYMSETPFASNQMYYQANPHAAPGDVYGAYN